MEKRLKELQEQRLQIAAQMKELASRQDNWTDEEKAQWKTLNDQYANVVAGIADIRAKQEAAAAVNARVAEIEQELRAGNVTMHGDEMRRRESTPELVHQNAEEDRCLALQAYFRVNCIGGLPERHQQACRRVGFNPAPREIELALPLDAYYNAEPAWSHRGRQLQRNLSAGVPSGGGFTIPEGFVNQMERKLLAFGGPRAVATVIRTASGNDLPWPTVDDTTNTGELLGEGATIGSSVDPTFGAVVFGAYKYSSKPILISQELLEDSAFNLAQLIGSLLGERLGRITGANFTTGTNASQPNGIATAAAAGKTTASATAITSDELIDLMHSVDPAYRVGATGWMMHDNVLLYVRKLKIGTNDYLWAPGLTSTEPDRLLGYPITINQHMASTVATTNRTVLFGDFSKYVIRDVASLRFYRLDELYRGNDRTGFISFLRCDADCIQTAAIKRLTQT